MNYRRKKAQAMYDGLPEKVKEDLLESITWAKKILTDKEGSGHEFFITAAGNDKGVVCSFAKPEWSGDHCGEPMEHGAEAIAMAVCEYLCGC